MLSPTHLRNLFRGLREAFDFREVEEITLEANPATFGRETAETFAQLGITRISLGAQSFHDGHLTTLGREHSPAEIQKSALLLARAGFTNLNIDLIYSIPGQTVTEWDDTLEQALALGVGHISAYNLTYEEDTAFFDGLQGGRFAEDPELDAEMYLLAHQKLTDLGFEHYETSNFGFKDHRSLHNQAYWGGADYLGLGPSAVSTIDRRRWKNVPDTARYLHQIDQVGHAETEIEELTKEQYDLERIALMLRTDLGVSVEHLDAVPDENVELIVGEGLAELADGRLRLIGRGPLLVDEILATLVV